MAPGARLNDDWGAAYLRDVLNRLPQVEQPPRCQHLTRTDPAAGMSKLETRCKVYAHQACVDCGAHFLVELEPGCHFRYESELRRLLEVEALRMLPRALPEHR